MSTIAEIEQSLKGLSPEDRAEFRAWFAEFDAEAWDALVERDIAAGRLDGLADEALNDLREGRCTGV